MGLISSYLLYKSGKRRASKKLQRYFDHLEYEVRAKYPNLDDDEINILVFKLAKEEGFFDD